MIHHALRRAAAALALAACAVAPPVLASVSLQSIYVDWSYAIPGQSGGFSGAMPLGPVGDSYSGYSITCYEDCAGKRWGGTTISGSWLADPTARSVSYAFNVIQGTDDGLASANLLYEATFHTARDPFVIINQRHSRPGPDCGNCQSNFYSYYSVNPAPSGGYDVVVGMITDASVSYGSQSAWHDVLALVGEVPEPGTWAMLLTGCFAVGGTLRARRFAG